MIYSTTNIRELMGPRTLAYGMLHTKRRPAAIGAGGMSQLPWEASQTLETVFAAPLTL